MALPLLELTYGPVYSPRSGLGLGFPHTELGAEGTYGPFLRNASQPSSWLFSGEAGPLGIVSGIHLFRSRSGDSEGPGSAFCDAE